MDEAELRRKILRFIWYHTNPRCLVPGREGVEPCIAIVGERFE